MLTRILTAIEAGAVTDKGAEQAVIKLGVSQLPEVMKDNTDRNRTSPFAFTGNKFEFRAVGSSASTAFPVTILNTAIADGMSEIIVALKEKLAAGKKTEDAIMEVVKAAVIETKKIRFEGNGYSEEWVAEAERRGLPNLRKTPEALHQLIEKKSIEFFTKYGVFSEAEVNSRYHVRVERYIKNLMIEVDTLKSMIDTQVLPAAYAYSGDLAQTVVSVKAAGVSAPQVDILNKIMHLIAALQTKRAQLETVYAKAESAHTEEEKAKLLAVEVSAAMAEIRQISDELESLIGDDYWPLPKYREMLFSS